MKLLVTLFSALAVVSANAAQGLDVDTDKATRRTLDARMGVPGPDGNVMISYTIDMWPAVVTLDIQTNKTGAATTLDSDWVSIGGVAIANAHGDVWKVVMGKRGKIEWAPGRDVDFRRARAVVTAWPLDDTPDFMVFNLLKPFGSEDAQTYYPRLEYLTGDGLWQVGAVTDDVASFPQVRGVLHQRIPRYAGAVPACLRSRRSQVRPEAFLKCQRRRSSSGGKSSIRPHPSFGQGEGERSANQGEQLAEAASRDVVAWGVEEIRQRRVALRHRFRSSDEGAAGVCRTGELLVRDFLFWQGTMS